MRAYIESTSLVDAGDQKRSATAAARGQIRESSVSAVEYSAHMHISPPSMRACSSGASFSASPDIGSTA